MSEPPQTVPVRRRRTLLRAGLSVVLFVLGVWSVPHRWCMRAAPAWYGGQPELRTALLLGVGSWLDRNPAREAFSTGQGQFDGEWLFGTHMMAAMAFGQAALTEPGRRAEYLPRIEQCLDRILSAQVREFDCEVWGNDPIETLDGAPHHAAFLGYFNLALSLHRFLEPQSRFADLNDRITAALVRRLEAEPLLLLQSYPWEIYPVDNCAAVASIGLYDAACGTDHSGLLGTWRARFEESCVDPVTGLVYQCIDPGTGLPGDHPRGSGTTLGLYFLSFYDMDLSSRLFEAVRRELFTTFLGFGAVREYPRTVPNEGGDIDSGPVVFGFGMSATGFLLGGSRAHEDPETFHRLYAAAHLMGAPMRRDGRLHFVSGGPLGDAILAAMLTAPSGGPTRGGDVP